jgi:N-acyl-D-amino-acid deacylase
MRLLTVMLILFTTALFSSCGGSSYDTIIRNGTVYDGSGGEGIKADIGINADTIAFIGDLSGAKGKEEIDAKGRAVAPGFINMLSWATESLLVDGRAQSDIRQGVTLEVMGEGWSMGPLNTKLKTEMQNDQRDMQYPVTWTTLGEYLQHLEKKGVSCNVASFVGATTLRRYIVGDDNKAATPQQLDSMRALVKQAMEEGALGVGSSLVYPPAFFSSTEELVALCQEASKYNGMYISHLRSEGARLHEGVEELIRIAKEANIRAEIYHLKALGSSNWNKMDSVIRRIERARKEGLRITADMYTYTAGGTGLDACLPPSMQDGGAEAFRKRLKDPAIRKEMIKAMNTPTDKWENFYIGAGSPDNIILVGFKSDSLKKYTGQTLGAVANLRGNTPEETVMDLIYEDGGRIDAIYFLMSEDNVKKQIPLPWMSYGSDEGAYTTEGNFLKFNPHPRAYGNFARLLGKYVRDEKLLPLGEAIRKLTGLPASNLGISRRGLLKAGYYADVVIFDPAIITDHADYKKPHAYATGVQYVWVNGVQMLKNGEHTGKTGGRFVKRGR